MNGWGLPVGRPAVMGVLNVTPDSFSDGGRFLHEDAAVARAETMLAEGADIVDIGGESTRPGAESVPIEEELRRVRNVVARVARIGGTVSIDTSKAEVARACLEAGAKIVNDVTALGDPDMVRVCAEARCAVCLMHMKGDPRTMQTDPQYQDVVQEVFEFLMTKASIAEENGIPRRDVWLDPGIGFGKTVAHNLSLLTHLDRLVATGHPILIGVSMKSFIGKLLGSEEDPAPVYERLEGTLAVQTVAVMKGVRIVRTHAVKETVRTHRLLHAMTQAD